MTEKKIVTIGGGTGSFVVLSGLKKYPVHLSAIVSMADDGGSTGILRDELGVLPPGDIRQCLVALSEAGESIRKLLNYRFENGGLKGHNFGNILLSALEKTMGGFDKGVQEASRVFNVNGEVIPITNDDIRLHLHLDNGSQLAGEYLVDAYKSLEPVKVTDIHLNRPAAINKRAAEAIKMADLIIIGPGDIYSSILPNFLVKGVREALAQSPAKVAYVCNLMMKKPFLSNFSVGDFADLVQYYLGGKSIDYVIYNTGKPEEKLAQRYSKEGEQIWFNKKDFAGKNYRAIGGNLLSPSLYQKNKADKLKRTLIRHDSGKLAKIIMKLC